MLSSEYKISAILVSLTKFDINSSTDLSFSTNKLISQSYTESDFFNIPDVLYLENSTVWFLPRSLKFPFHLFFLDGVSLWLLWLSVTVAYVLSFSSSKKESISDNSAFLKFRIYID